MISDGFQLIRQVFDVKPLNRVCVLSTAVGNITVSIPIDDKSGKATVREHFPKQEMSWIVSIFFMFLFLQFSSGSALSPKGGKAALGKPP